MHWTLVICAIIVSKRILVELTVQQLGDFPENILNSLACSAMFLLAVARYSSTIDAPV
jgi:hypothetical protein